MERDNDFSLSAAPLRFTGPPLATELMYDPIVQQIVDFEAGLAADEEVGAKLAQFGQTVTISIEDIGYHGSHLMLIYGATTDGHRCTLLQHFSQVNILLVALKVKPGEQARRIGFKLKQEREPSSD